MARELFDVQVEMSDTASGHEWNLLVDDVRVPLNATGVGVSTDHGDNVRPERMFLLLLQLAVAAEVTR